MDKNFIIDLGMHLALDTEFYLKKGFRVVSVDAAPWMVNNARDKLGAYLASQQLTIVDKALWSAVGQEISFYINDIKHDWSSAFRWWAEKGGHQAREIKVQTTTLAKLFEQFGVPYYIKCDIEGADEIFVRQLLESPQKPAFVSVEAVSLDVLALLFASGYDRFQIVNQAFSGYVKPPNPPLEGLYADATFNGHMSGLFGRELNENKWISFTEASRQYLDFRDLKKQDEALAHGWLDLHAGYAENLVLRN